MQRKTLFHIVPEGWVILTGLVTVFFIVNALLGFVYGVPVLVVVGVAVGYFHDTPRDVAAEPLAVIAPVDGTVIHRRECHDPYLDREAIRLSLRVSFFGVYLLRSPVEGTVVELLDEIVERQGRAVSQIRTDEGDNLIIAVTRGTLLGERPCRNSFGERVGQGRCCGVRRLARQIDIYLPLSSRLEVELHDTVRAGSCVLAKLVHKQKTARRSGMHELSGVA